LGAVEQILGRILRLPYCKPREVEDLNRAYAFVSSSNFAAAAQNLVDALVENGFNRQEAQDFIKPAEPGQPSLSLQYGQRIPPPKIITLSEVPNPERLSSKLRDKIDIDQESRTITLKDVSTEMRKLRSRTSLLPTM
jgi:type III restriction enzyme